MVVALVASLFASAAASQSRALQPTFLADRAVACVRNCTPNKISVLMGADSSSRLGARNVSSHPGISASLRMITLATDLRADREAVPSATALARATAAFAALAE
eukprot:4577158-Prymnesium_polylepis.1